MICEVNLMSALNHPDYEKEIDYLSNTLAYLKDYTGNILKAKGSIDSKVDYAVKHFNSDNAEQFNELIINTALQQNMNDKLKNLYKSLSKPYFARVDFKENKEDIIKQLYVGKVSLIKDKDEFLIVDWRSPIATLYYEGRLGKANYDCPDGTIHGEISLKRQYTIEQALLKEIYDVDITTNDDFLQAALGSNKDNRLKDIVSTIQSEQNRVIRATPWKPLIVQGAAGGGKTTIALHRIAYLLYNYENSFKAENFMIIAPNRFFLSYISEVLPELGVENVKQTTFEDFAMDFIGLNIKIENSNEKLCNLISNNKTVNEKFKKDLIDVSAFKSSLGFKVLIDEHINILQNHIVPKEDFAIHNTILIPKTDIQKLFLQEYVNLPMTKRVMEIKKHLQNKVKYNKEKILEDLEKEYDFKLNKLRYSMADSPQRRKLFIDLTAERDSLLLSIKNKSKTLVKDYINKFKIPSPLDFYKALFHEENTETLWIKFLSKEQGEKVRYHSVNKLNNNTLEIEDLAPLIYITFRLIGVSEKFNLKHVVIDEAQDFSLFQIWVLKNLINTSSFTILGDLCQGIHSYRGIKSWSSLKEEIFHEDDCTLLNLEQSYRTTIEIMNEANKVISSLKDSNFPAAKPVIRHGKEVVINSKNSIKDISLEICNQLKSFEDRKLKSLALICKDMEECKEIKSLLKPLGYNLKIISEKEKEYNSGIILIPSYLVKGLEFDMVIITNASSYSFNELDVKLLYIAMTRPLHELYIYSTEDLWLNNLQKNKS